MADKIVGEFVGTLLHSATVTHIMHLSTRSYAEHKALNEYYDGIVDLVDSFAESYQGKYGLIKEYPNGYTQKARIPLDYLTTVRDMVKEKREELPQDSELQNSIDEITDLLNSTIYKLTFLD